MDRQGGGDSGLRDSLGQAAQSFFADQFVAEGSQQTLYRSIRAKRRPPLYEWIGIFEQPSKRLGGKMWAAGNAEPHAMVGVCGQHLDQFVGGRRVGGDLHAHPPGRVQR
jgi:hypothetical protein